MPEIQFEDTLDFARMKDNDGGLCNNSTRKFPNSLIANFTQKKSKGSVAQKYLLLSKTKVKKHKVNRHQSDQNF